MHIQMTFPQLEVHRIVNQFENPVHAHDEQYQITLVTSGACHFSYENRKLRLGAGEGLLLLPSDLHNFHLEDGSGVLVLIANDVDGAMISKPSDAGGGPMRIPFDTGLARTWLDAAFLCERSDLLAAQETESLMLHQLQQLLHGGSSTLSAEPQRAGSGGMTAVGRPALPGRADPHVARALEYIHDRFREPISVEEIAAVALQSRYHFIRTFKAATGMTPYHYVLHLRLAESLRLLRQTRSTVTEISLQLGFSTPSQLYRMFDRYVQVTPEQYRLLQ
ncbi:AraC family transcriptional regulator [Paenibacillus sp. 598K]|uniref:helix-turn-helix domain-containing protein n=1 Tax=Paenibacillus sp. 598K TaxID=1117987 RepID=UPI000FFACDD9|nr:AraC family transcriptional regulator [Paenibacillus sp. 598K]GBF73610.1 AraC family transcriptional regulator [Paenibacillus sp. 598K]